MQISICISKQPSNHVSCCFQWKQLSLEQEKALPGIWMFPSILGLSTHTSPTHMTACAKSQLWQEGTRVELPLPGILLTSKTWDNCLARLSPPCLAFACTAHQEGTAEQHGLLHFCPGQPSEDTHMHTYTIQRGCHG